MKRISVMELLQILLDVVEPEYIPILKLVCRSWYHHCCHIAVSLEYQITGFVKEGHVNLLEWLSNYTCLPRLDAICSTAILNDRQIVLGWLITKGYVPLNSDRISTIKNDKLAMYRIIVNTHPLHKYEQDYELAVKHGHADFVKFFYKCEIVTTHQICVDAAFYGHMHIIRSEIKKGVSLNDSFTEAAVSGGQLETLITLYELGCPLGDVLNIAVHYGHWDIMEWSLVNGFQPNHMTIRRAVMSRNTTVLKWVFDHMESFRCRDKKAFKKAAMNDDIETMECLKQYKHYWGMMTRGWYKRTGYDEKVALWLATNLCP